MAARDAVLAACALGVVACAGPAYAPCPVTLEAALPTDAFARCRSVLRREYHELAVADEAAFRLQTAWVAVDEPPGERRATVFCDRADGAGLWVIVELRRVTLPLLGLPGWTEPRGDDAAERALARALQDELAASVATGN